jgi:DNA-binding transcriptional MerR regulator
VTTPARSPVDDQKLTSLQSAVQIGEAAERVGMSVRSLRYWEEIGLLVPSARTTGGFRLYSESDLRRVLILKSMKPLGLSLEQMKDLLALIEAGESSEVLSTDELDSVAARVAGWIEETSAAIEKLERRLGEAHQLRLRLGETLAVVETTMRLARGKRRGRGLTRRSAS